MIPHMKLKNQQSEVSKVMTGVTLEGVAGGVVSGVEHRGSMASEAQITCLLIRVVVTWVCSRILQLCVHFSEQ